MPSTAEQNTISMLDAKAELGKIVQRSDTQETTHDPVVLGLARLKMLEIEEAKYAREAEEEKRKTAEAEAVIAADKKRDDRKFWLKIVLVLVPVLMGTGGWKYVTTEPAPPEVKPADVKEAVEASASDLDVLIKGDGNGNKGLQQTVTEQGEQIHYLYVESETQALQSYDLAKMMSEQNTAGNPKAAKVNTDALDAAETRAKAIKLRRKERKEKHDNPFEK